VAVQVYKASWGIRSQTGSIVTFYLLSSLILLLSYSVHSDALQWRRLCRGKHIEDLYDARPDDDNQEERNERFAYRKLVLPLGRFTDGNIAPLGDVLFELFGFVGDRSRSRLCHLDMRAES
jgi:hypothetical protein